MRRIANIHTHMSDMYSQPKNPELVPQIYSLPEISAHFEIPNQQTYFDECIEKLLNFGIIF